MSATEAFKALKREHDMANLTHRYRQACRAVAQAMLAVDPHNPHLIKILALAKREAEMACEVADNLDQQYDRAQSDWEQKEMF